MSWHEVAGPAGDPIPFTFTGAAVSGGRVELGYRMADRWDLTEVVELPVDLPDTPEVAAAVRVLHLVAGVSYYKCVAPVPLATGPLSEAEAALARALYDEGLREFAYRNGFGVPLPVELRSEAGGLGGGAGQPIGGAGSRPGTGALVPIGGGKDSALVAALVPDGLPFAVNPVGAHEHLALALGRKLVGARRTLDPQLRDLVTMGAPNGHVPVTAITSAISVLAALALGRGDVLMGIERSADEPTVVTPDGVPVNHQFSKSWEAEQLLRAAFGPTGVRYLSLLRPMSELGIGASVAARGLAPHI
ncbi:MAG: endonuclease domain-containing protein, partial [Actinobacteria bacterium]|nr:endonuclease domain-containing protein [Actinomycetota bacterium]